MVDTSNTQELQTHTFPLSDAMAKRGGKFCAAGGPGQISCTNNSYSPGISMHTFPMDEKIRAKWVDFVRVHRPTFSLGKYNALCSLHFSASCFTPLKLEDLMSDSAETRQETTNFISGKPVEKRILIRGSVPTIHCANNAPEIKERSDRDRRRSQAVSVKSSHVSNFHNRINNVVLARECFH